MSAAYYRVDKTSELYNGTVYPSVELFALSNIIQPAKIDISFLQVLI